MLTNRSFAPATACDWLGNYLVVQATPPGIHHLRWGYYLIYGVINVSLLPLIYYFLVETRGRSLEETDRWFHKNPGWFVHKANHSPEADFELASDDDESPVTRRASFPHIEK
jgi:hypothetical protein